MVGLSQLHEKAAVFKDRLPDTLRMMRASRAFMRSVDPLQYWWSWAGAVWGGLSALSVFASVGVLVQQSSNELVNKYIDLKHLTWPLVLGITFVIVLYFGGRELLRSLARLREEYLRIKVKTVTERQNTELLASLDVGRLTDPDFLRLMTMATGSSDGYSNSNPLESLHTAQRRLLTELVGLTASVSIISVLDPVFILFALLPVALEVTKGVLIDNIRRSLYVANYDLEKKMNEYHNCLTVISLLLQGKLFRYNEYWLSRYRELRNELEQRWLSLSWSEFKWDRVVTASELLVFTVIMLYLGSGLVHGSITLPKVFFLWGSMQTLLRALSGFGSTFARIRDRSLMVGYREQFLSAKPLNDEGEARQYTFTSTPKLEMREVCFRYPRTDDCVVSNCSLSIAPGEKVALVGDNGSGKTTILRLLAKVYLPDTGIVSVDNIPISHITQSCWHEQLLYSTQEKMMPEFVLEEAITGTRPGASNLERLRIATEFSRANVFIEKLPMGLQTQLGADWDNGWEPSGGQEQRLKLTAAFYRLLEPNVHIGLIDEPMSECDIKTRAWFYQSLRSLADKTIIVVAHDPVYLHCFDRVILIERGRVAREMCTPDEIASYQQQAVQRFEKEHGERLRVVK